mmetsp:Transcript_128234/g.225969  ORF Transcript_128234/g.225969 Transcript_128234/m.225969 type:complete len:232 (+) Transcript_128234:381-1076(+)
MKFCTVLLCACSSDCSSSSCRSRSATISRYLSFSASMRAMCLPGETGALDDQPSLPPMMVAAAAAAPPPSLTCMETERNELTGERNPRRSSTEMHSLRSSQRAFRLLIAVPSSARSSDTSALRLLFSASKLASFFFDIRRLHWRFLTMESFSRSSMAATVAVASRGVDRARRTLAVSAVAARSGLARTPGPPCHAGCGSIRSLTRHLAGIRRRSPAPALPAGTALPGTSLG